MFTVVSCRVRVVLSTLWEVMMMMMMMMSWASQRNAAQGSPASRSSKDAPGTASNTVRSPGSASCTRT